MNELVSCSYPEVKDCVEEIVSKSICPICGAPVFLDNFFHSYFGFEPEQDFSCLFICSICGARFEAKGLITFDKNRGFSLNVTEKKVSQE